ASLSFLTVAADSARSRSVARRRSLSTRPVVSATTASSPPTPPLSSRIGLYESVNQQFSGYPLRSSGRYQSSTANDSPRATRSNSGPTTDQISGKISAPALPSAGCLLPRIGRYRSL